MKLDINISDPLKVLSTTKPVIEQSKFVFLSENGLNQISKLINQKLVQGLGTAQDIFGATGNFKNDVQLIFLQTVTNFCFWAEKDKPKWQIEWKNKNISGFYALSASFQRAQIENKNIFNANYLSEINRDEVVNIFRSNNQTEIPLLDERVKNLREAGRFLKDKYNGQFINALEETNFDAIEIAKLLYANLISFRDVAKLDEQEVVFLKRAQIGPNDLSYLSDKKYKSITNLDTLTAFADYKLPQMLREFGVIEYSTDLAKHIDNLILIPVGSREEIEIRAATIWGIELIRQKLGKYSAREIDNALWFLSQDQTGKKPYHRTYTIYY